MKKELEVIKELKEKTLEQVIEKHGDIAGDFSKLYLSIWDVREILYNETKKIADRVIKEQRESEDEEFRRVFR